MGCELQRESEHFREFESIFENVIGYQPGCRFGPLLKPRVKICVSAIFLGWVKTFGIGQIINQGQGR